MPLLIGIQYVVNKLTSEETCDLLVFQELIQAMTGTEVNEGWLGRAVVMRLTRFVFQISQMSSSQPCPEARHFALRLVPSP